MSNETAVNLKKAGARETQKGKLRKLFGKCSLFDVF